MVNFSGDKKKTVAIAAATLATLAGLGLWVTHKKNSYRLGEAQKQLTNLRFDLSVDEIHAETESIIAKMQKTDDEIACLPLENVTYACVVQKIIDLDAELLSRVTNVTFLGHVSTNKEIRDACTKADEKIEDYLVKRGMRGDVYKVIRQLMLTSEFQVT